MAITLGDIHRIEWFRSVANAAPPRGTTGPGAQAPDPVTEGEAD